MIYFDNSATTRPFDAVIDAVAGAMQTEYYNPSALYAQAMGVKAQLDACRAQITQVLLTREHTTVFTSGGTEAINLAIKGSLMQLRGQKGHFILLAIEHAAVLECAKYLKNLGHEIDVLGVDENGIADLAALEMLLRPDTFMLCAMHLNNEVGAVQPILQMGTLLKRLSPKALFMVDGVQGFLHAPLSLAQAQVDLYALSAHKIHGPKGTGALVVKKGVRLMPQLHGGGQEDGMRSTTENTYGIIGLGAAIAEHAHFNMADVADLRKRLIEGALQVGGVLNGPQDCALAPHIANISFPLKAEVLLHALEGEGILTATGAACSSHKRAPSHVLTAMGLKKQRVEGALRFSLSHLNTIEEVDITIAALKRIVPNLSAYVRR